MPAFWAACLTRWVGVRSLARRRISSLVSSSSYSPFRPL